MIMKKIFRCLPLVVALVVLAGCSTPESRIHNRQAAFDSWPADVQQQIRAGHVAIGYTAEMVQVALGEADRSYTRTTPQGTSDVWVYFDHGPKFAVGIGVGGYSGNTAIGTSVAVGNEGFRDGEVMRVIFEGGRVVAIETRHK